MGQDAGRGSGMYEGKVTGVKFGYGGGFRVVRCTCSRLELFPTVGEGWGHLMAVVEAGCLLCILMASLTLHLLKCKSPYPNSGTRPLPWSCDQAINQQ